MFWQVFRSKSSTAKKVIDFCIFQSYDCINKKKGVLTMAVFSFCEVNHKTGNVVLMHAIGLTLSYSF